MRSEGVQRAIAKPSARLRRGEILLSHIENQTAGTILHAGRLAYLANPVKSRTTSPAMISPATAGTKAVLPGV